MSGALVDSETREVVSHSHEKVLEFFSVEFSTTARECEDLRLTIVRKLQDLSARFVVSRKLW
jgi:hypothetical protein